jgi:SPW repeat
MTTLSAKWQDWASFALGLWLAISPWAGGYAGHDAATANAVFVGLALALGAHFEAACDLIQAEWLNVCAGAWLIAAPFVLGFSGANVAAANSLAVGASVVALALSALWMDKEIGKLWQKKPRF